MYRFVFYGSLLCAILACTSSHDGKRVTVSEAELAVYSLDVPKVIKFERNGDFRRLSDSKQANLLGYCLSDNIYQINDGRTRDKLMANANEVAAVLIDSGMNVNTTTSTGMPPIYAAIQDNRIGAVEELLKHGALPNAVNPESVTPLRRLPPSGPISVRF